MGLKRTTAVLATVLATVLSAAALISQHDTSPFASAFTMTPRIRQPSTKLISGHPLHYQLCPECDTDQDNHKSHAWQHDRSDVDRELTQQPSTAFLPAMVTPSNILDIDIRINTHIDTHIDTLPHLHGVTISLLSDKPDGQTQTQNGSRRQTQSGSERNINDTADTASMPLVISPSTDQSSSLQFLQTFMKTHREWLDRQMLHYGAILFRGFDIQQASDVEAAIQSYQPNLNNQYRGTSPRDVQPNTNYIFSAAEAPSYFPIAQHIEMSFLPAPPKQLFFSALQAPKTAGGETALADFRKVYTDIQTRAPKLFEKLLTKKLKYTRTHHRNGARWTHDVAAMQGWSDVFGTTDKAVVEALAKEEDLTMQWEGKNNDTFVSEYVSDAFQLHPQTKQPVWFNHAQVFHPTTFPADLVAAFRRTKQWRLLWHAARVTAFSMIWYGLLRQKMALHVTFGDGSAISPREMHIIRSAIHRNMVFNRWQQGDLVMIDNFSTSHGRQPTYDKGRKVVVAWSDPVEKSDLLSSIDDANAVASEEMSIFG